MATIVNDGALHLRITYTDDPLLKIILLKTLRAGGVSPAAEHLSSK
jgi:hypothetical protein